MKIKRFLALALALVMLSSVCLMAMSCGGNNEEKRADISDAAKGAYTTVVDEVGRVINDYTTMATNKMTYVMPMSYSDGVPSTYSGPLASTKVYCEVSPNNAFDKTVTWSVAWAEDAYRSAENVSDYVQIRYDNSINGHLCNVDLLQYFGEDTIILTVRTNDGGFTDSCELTCFEAVDIQLSQFGVPVEVQSSELIGVKYDGVGYVDFSYLCFDNQYELEFNTDSRYKNKYSFKIENVSYFNAQAYIDKVNDGWTFNYFYGVDAPDFVKNESFETDLHGYLCYDPAEETGFKTFVSPIRGDFINILFDGLVLTAESYDSFVDGTCGHGIDMSSLGYDVFDTYAPVMFKITVSESVCNTSDSIYVTMNVPITSVSLFNIPTPFVYSSGDVNLLSDTFVF